MMYHIEPVPGLKPQVSAETADLMFKILSVPVAIALLVFIYFVGVVIRNANADMRFASGIKRKHPNFNTAPVEDDYDDDMMDGDEIADDESLGGGMIIGAEMVEITIGDADASAIAPAPIVITIDPPAAVAVPTTTTTTTTSTTTSTTVGDGTHDASNNV